MQDFGFGNLRDLPSPCKIFQVFAGLIIFKKEQKNAASSHKTQDILLDQSRVSRNCNVNLSPSMHGKFAF